MLVEDDSGHVASETRQYRTYGAELRVLVGWRAGLELSWVVMENTGVFWKSVQRALWRLASWGRHQHLAKRRGAARAVVAAAHKILVGHNACRVTRAREHGRLDPPSTRDLREARRQDVGVHPGSGGLATAPNPRGWCYRISTTIRRRR